MCETNFATLWSFKKRARERAPNKVAQKISIQIEVDQISEFYYASHEALEAHTHAIRFISHVSMWNSLSRSTRMAAKSFIFAMLLTSPKPKANCEFTKWWRHFSFDLAAPWVWETFRHFSRWKISLSMAFWIFFIQFCRNLQLLALFPFE